MWCLFVLSLVGGHPPGQNHFDDLTSDPESVPDCRSKNALNVTALDGGVAIATAPEAHG